MDALVDDLRSTELESLEAIYPEIHHPYPDEPFIFEIELPVAPANPVTVRFPPPSGAAGTVPLVRHELRQAAPEDDFLEVSYLPSLRLRITLPEGYPHDKPPKVNVSTNPRWLPQRILQHLEDEAPRLWEEVGCDLVAYTYIDHIHRAADDVFDATTEERTLLIDGQHKLALLDYDIKAKKEAFEKETFECEVCLDPKKGSNCHKMIDCGHIFCLRCLQDFYSDAIKEGSLSSVRCLAPNCAKNRSIARAPVAEPGTRLKKPKTYISPSELLQIGVEEDAVKRFVALMYKTELETDKNTIYCPRPTCNGAARSERHRKPEGFELNDFSDAETEEDEAKDAQETEEAQLQRKGEKKPYDPADLLAICDDCGFAFCRRCYHSWHGEFIYCRPKVDNGDITAEEKASLEYLQLHTSPCPTCSAPAQKTHGCNHMICSRCDSHFCYLCSAWLDPTNPYRHYNIQPNGKVTGCYMRLWELEDGDGDDVGLGFVGGLIQRLDQAQPEPVAPVEARDEPVPNNEERGEVADRVDGPQAAHEGLLPPAVAREAPLVLRIMDHRPPPAPPPPEQPAGGRGRGHRGRGRGARAQGNRGGGFGQRGRGRGAPPPRPIAAQQQPARPRGAGVAQHAHGVQEGEWARLPLAGDEALDPEQQAWVRRFVEMALIDAEDEFDGDSDDDINFVIR